MMIMGPRYSCKTDVEIGFRVAIFSGQWINDGQIPFLAYTLWSESESIEGTSCFGVPVRKLSSIRNMIQPQLMHPALQAAPQWSIRRIEPRPPKPQRNFFTLCKCHQPPFHYVHRFFGWGFDRRCKCNLSPHQGSSWIQWRRGGLSAGYWRTRMHATSAYPCLMSGQRWDILRFGCSECSIYCPAVYGPYRELLGADKEVRAKFGEWEDWTSIAVAKSRMDPFQSRGDEGPTEYAAWKINITQCSVGSWTHVSVFYLSVPLLLINISLKVYQNCMYCLLTDMIPQVKWKTTPMFRSNSLWSQRVEFRVD